MAKRKRLLLVTNSYPDANSKEKSFVYPELVALEQAGFAVTVMPARRCGALDPDLPTEVEVSDVLSRKYRALPALAALLSLLGRTEFWSELASKPILALRFRFWKDSLRAAISSTVFRGLISKYDLYYTYWFSGETTGMVFSGVTPAITRAHGYDLYVERQENHGWIPYRSTDLRKLHRVVVLSGKASRYLEEKYGFSHLRCIVSPLGVSDKKAAIFDEAVHDRKVVFFSCSFPSAVKRIPLIYRFAVAFAKAHPEKSIEWVHVGAHRSDIDLGDPLEDEPPNLSVKFDGPRTNSYVLEFLAREHITFFVNLSEMEGLPVSIMEAMAFGIPAVATDVGCVSDLLEDGGGLLVSPDIEASDLVDKVSKVLDDARGYFSMRSIAIETQRKKFNEIRNHAALTCALERMC